MKVWKKDNNLIVVGEKNTPYLIEKDLRDRGFEFICYVHGKFDYITPAMSKNLHLITGYTSAREVLNRFPLTLEAEVRELKNKLKEV